jgi:hypothetical protein
MTRDEEAIGYMERTFRAADGRHAEPTREQQLETECERLRSALDARERQIVQLCTAARAMLSVERSRDFDDPKDCFCSGCAGLRDALEKVKP